MKLIFQRILIALCIVGLNGLPAQTKQDQSKQVQTPQKKRRRVPRKRPPQNSKKRPVKRPTAQKKPANRQPVNKKQARRRPAPRKRPTAKQAAQRRQPQRRPVRRAPQKQQQPPKTVTQPKVNRQATAPKAPSVNPMKMATELKSMTEELETSSRKLSMAKSYLEPVNRQKVVTIESRAVDGTPGKVRPADLKKEVQTAESQRDWEKVRDLTISRIQIDPTNPNLHYDLGRAYTRLGDLNKARQAFEEALDIDPEHQPTLNAVASLSRSSDTRMMSSAVLNYTSERKMGGPAGQMAEIHEDIATGKFDEAQSLAQKGLDTYPDQSGFKFLEGLALEKQGSTEEAKIAYQQAIKIDHNNLEAHKALANLYYDLGKYVYAGLTYGDLTQLNPTDEDAWYLEGLCYYKANEWGKAVGAWEALRKINPQHALLKIMLPQTYYVLAVEYNRNGEPALGRTAFDKAMNLNPNTYSWLPESMRTLGRYYRDKKMYKESLAAYQQVVELRPKDASAYMEMGVTYWKMDEAQLARAAWDKSLELNPDNNEARGWLLISRQGS